MKVAQAHILTILKSDCDISRGDRMCKQTPIFFQLIDETILSQLTKETKQKHFKTLERDKFCKNLNNQVSNMNWKIKQPNRVDKVSVPWAVVVAQLVERLLPIAVIWGSLRNFATLAKVYWSLAIFWHFISYLAKCWAYFGHYWANFHCYKRLNIEK